MMGPSRFPFTDWLMADVRSVRQARGALPRLRVHDGPGVSRREVCAVIYFLPRSPYLDCD